MTLKLVCQEYVFLLTSGQLDDAAWDLKLRAAHHRLVCHRCRAFTHNDAALDRIFSEHKARAQTLSQLKPNDPADEV